MIALSAWLAPTSSAGAEQLALANYIRSDSDETIVVAPRLRLQVPLSDATTVDAVYGIDVWSSASIDIRTSASKRPVTEQRDELDLSVAHEFADVSISGGYRYSTEPDYNSHGGFAGMQYEFADNNATLGLSVSASSDDVGRAGSPNFSESVATVGGRVSLTQVIDEDTFAQVLYDLNHVSGYQSSPYRFVAIGGERGDCWRDETEVDPLTMALLTPPPRAPSPLCLEEANPDKRLRHAVVLQGRHALGDTLSMGAAYRLYTDDWGLSSHTLRGELAWLPGEDSLLAVQYRLYFQGSVDHYKPVYEQEERFVTSDKELSSLSSHRLSLEFEHTFPLADGDAELKLNVSVAPSIYFYDEFPLLDSITAFDVNSAVVMVL